MDVTMEEIRELREKTGVGIMDCKKALKDANGDMEEAVTILRKKGLATAQKRSGKSVNEGVIAFYIHHNGKIGVMMEINCETDFVARTDDFQALAKDICMHIAAAAPGFVDQEEIPEEVLNKEKEIFKAQALESGKPENIVDKIVEGRVKKYYEEAVLLEQAFVKDQDKKIRDIISEAIAKMGENIKVSRFIRYQLGESSRDE